MRRRQELQSRGFLLCGRKPNLIDWDGLWWESNLKSKNWGSCSAFCTVHNSAHRHHLGDENSGQLFSIFRGFTALAWQDGFGEVGSAGAFGRERWRWRTC